MIDCMGVAVRYDHGSNIFTGYIANIEIGRDPSIHRALLWV